MTASTHAHCFHAGAVGESPLVLLHGSHGSESDLIPVADEIAPEASKLSVRGTVSMDEGYAFFHRLPDRRVDPRDIVTRTRVLAGFIATACADYNLTRRPVAIGFSNGAIMGAALLITYPGLLAGAILFRPLAPFAHDLADRVDNTPVLIVDGAHDNRRSPGDGLQLAEQLRRAGARVTHQVLSVGHAITAEDKIVAREWLLAQRY
ncbi:alpha/beta hydrolase [Nocardia sp. NPDC055049]